MDAVDICIKERYNKENSYNLRNSDARREAVYMEWNSSLKSRFFGNLLQEFTAVENNTNTLSHHIKEELVRERVARLRLMCELADGRKSGEEEGWIPSEEVREHFRARANVK